MKKTFKIIIPLIITVVLFSVFSTTYAALNDYTVLAPLPGIGNAGGTTNLETYLPAAFNLAIGIGAVLAFIMITWGGITYATSDAISGKAQGKEWITNAIWGLLLVISAWIILATINPQILKFNLSLDVPQVKAGQPTVIPGVPMTPEQIAADAVIRTRLQGAGVAINAGPCTAGQTRGCTNLNGLPANAVTGLINLNIACRCNVTVTGGTEGGHRTHGAGAPVVDIRPSSALNSYLRAPNPSDGSVATSPPPPSGGIIGMGPRAGYTYETIAGNPSGTSTGQHWHVVFQ